MKNQKTLNEMSAGEIKEEVKKRYSKVVEESCAVFNFPVGKIFTLKVGYPKEMLQSLPLSMYESFTGANIRAYK